MKHNENIYIPSKATIQRVKQLTSDVSLFTLKTTERPAVSPGQFFMISVFGWGEVPISIASSSEEELSFCIRKMGAVTSAIHELRAGDLIGLRGPYGNGFSLDAAKGRDIIVMAGGLGIVPLRPLIHELMSHREQYGRVSVLYGSRLPSEILFTDEISQWEEAGIQIINTVDCSEGDWKGCVGIVTSLVTQVEADFPEASAFVCGPDAMIRASMNELSEKGIPDDRIITSLEAHMKCGVGKCGHCYKGAGYVCTSGPVFSLRELKAFEAHDAMATET